MDRNDGRVFLELCRERKSYRSSSRNFTGNCDRLFERLEIDRLGLYMVFKRI